MPSIETNGSLMGAPSLLVPRQRGYDWLAGTGERDTTASRRDATPARRALAQVSQLVGIADRVDRDDSIVRDLERDRLDARGGTDHEARQAVDTRALDVLEG